MRHGPLLVLPLLLAVAPVASAQSGGFIARLGIDTMQVEQFTRTGHRLEGTVVTRSPVTRISRWQAELGPDGTFSRFTVATTNGDGSPPRGGVARATYTWANDSLIRELVIDGQASEQRLAAPRGVVPAPSLPYLGVTYLAYEVGFRAARGQSADSTGAHRLPQVYAITRQSAPAATRVWFPAADSAEMDYFGVARSGWRFNAAGDLIRADWRGTTYRYLVERIAAPDVAALAAAWSAQDVAGRAMGAMSPRDSARGTIQGIELAFDYSRPSRRGRVLWGDVVPWDRVWRLGADMATHMTLSAPARLGGTDVPAGRYTLWMLPSERGQTLLIINRRVNIFGTNYDPASDLVRIPMERQALDAPVERLTLAVEAGRLWVRWGDAAYSVPVTAP
jgi:hypothetical protein